MKKLLLSLLTLSFLLGSMDFSKTSENILIAYFLLLELKELNNLDVECKK